MIDEFSKIIKKVPCHDTHMTNAPGAHDKISPDQYFEYVESSGRDPAPRSQGEPEGMTRRAPPRRVIFLTGDTLAQYWQESLNTNMSKTIIMRALFVIFLEVLKIQKLGP